MSAESFLARWSRRKQAVQADEAAEPPPAAQPEPAASDVAPEAAGAGEAQPDIAESEITADEIARLPSLEELTAETDLTPFLRRGVPEALRNGALRRMWSLDPQIRDFVSEAREYAYDWNTPGGVPGSGGPLPPPEEIRRLAEQIVGGRPPPDQDAVTPESDVQAASSPVAAPTDEAATADGDPAHRPHPADPPVADADGMRAADAPPSAPLLPVDPGRSPRRRHGSATPC